MRIKHLIVTRFLCNSNMSLGDKVFDKDIINEGLRLLNTYLIPSLENQTNKNFTLVLLIHDKANEENIGFNMSTSFDVKIMKVSEYDAYLEEVYNDYQFVIQTTQDYDDCVYYNFVEDTQSSVDETLPYKVHGYVDGAKLKTWEVPQHLYYCLCYNGKDAKGLIGIGLSIICNTTYNTESVLKLSHHLIKEWLAERYRRIGIDDIPDGAYEKNLDKKLTYIYVRHMQNASNGQGKLDSLKFGNVIDISKESVKKTFGIDIV